MVPLEPGFTDCGSFRIRFGYNGRRRERGSSPQRPADLGVVDNGCTSGGIHQEGRAGQDGNRNPGAVARLLPAG